MSSPFDAVARSVVSTIHGIYGSKTSFTYSRPQSVSFDAIAVFAIEGSLNMGGEYATPDGPLAGSFLVRNSDIPLGPKKGDLLVVTNDPPQDSDGTYTVQVLPMSDRQIGWSTLGLRRSQ